MAPRNVPRNKTRRQGFMVSKDPSGRLRVIYFSSEQKAQFDSDLKDGCGEFEPLTQYSKWFEEEIPYLDVVKCSALELAKAISENPSWTYQFSELGVLDPDPHNLSRILKNSPIPKSYGRR